METYVDDTGTIDGFQEVVREAIEEGNAQSLLILSCDGNEYTAENLSPVLKGISVPVFGGTFPIVLNGTEQMKQGTVVVAMGAPSELHYIPGMSDPDADYEDVLDSKVGDDDTVKTLIVFVDGLSSRIATFIDSLYTVFGLEVNYVGGGAGSLSLEQKPCIITNDGLMEDGGIVAAFPMESGVGVSHGWETVSGPFKVTKSERNIVKELDWRPAFEVYREAVESNSDERFVTSTFFDIAKAYPFGIARMESERVVRDILFLNEEDHLVCVAEVPEGEYVDILHGEAGDLIKAAGQAHVKAQENSPEGKPGIQLFMDCISRVLFLRTQFSEEVESVVTEGLPLVGACTIGEIANSGNDYLEFYNKTSVVAFLEGE